MASIYEPLELMLYKRQSVFATYSLSFLHPNRRLIGFTGVKSTSLASDKSEQSTIPATIQADLAPPSDRLLLTGDSGSLINPKEMFVQTRYGVRMDMDSEDEGRMSISEVNISEKSTSPKDEASKAAAGQSGGRHHYRLFPDWQTSYLWYDLSKDTSSSGPDDPHVDLEVIEERYPALSPYYETWRELYETAFEQQECHLGSGAEVFPDIESRISWETEGFFLAIWLALRKDVDSVQYSPNSTTYTIQKESIEPVLRQFLQDKAAEKNLGDKDGG